MRSTRKSVIKEEDEMTEPILTINQLHTSFRVDGEMIPAVEGIDLTLYPGKSSALSGSPGAVRV